jgi:predicted HicB family RNase H-like nuclease
MKIVFAEQVKLYSESESRQGKQPEDLYSGNLKIVL